MTTARIRELWKNLLSQRSASEGLILRRCPTTVAPNIYAAVTSPESFKCLAVSIPDNIEIDVSDFTNLQDIAVELSGAGPNRGENLLVLKLLDSRLSDIFAVLCDDLIATVAEVHDDSLLARVLLTRFENWKTLFDKARSTGLSPEEQRGLFGELYFVRKAISSVVEARSILESWLGPSGGVWDFQTGPTALEVKTTIASGHKHIRISNERRLDRTNLEKLYLYVLSLDRIDSAGETLNALVDEIDRMMDFGESNRFKSKLYEYGYFDHHRDLYDLIGYVVCGETFYEVRDDFPRIEESDLKLGVGDVKYSIALAGCEQYSVPDKTVLDGMNFL